MKMTRAGRIGIVAAAFLSGVVVTASVAVALMGGQVTPSHGAATTTAPSHISIVPNVSTDASAAAQGTDGQIKQAQDHVKNFPKDVQGYLNLAGAYMQKARETLDISYYALTDTTLQRAAQLAPRNDAVTADQAWLALVRHDFTTSATLAQKAIDIRADNTQAYGILGDAQSNLGNYDAATAAYQKMVDLKPGLSSYNRASYMRWLNGDNNGSNVFMIMAVNAGVGAPAENLAWCQTALADNYFNQGATVNAAQEYQTALKTFPNYPNALVGLARTKWALQDYNGAIALYKQAIAIVPLPQYATELGDLYSYLGRKSEAKTEYNLVDFENNLFIANKIDVNIDAAYFHADHDQDLANALKIAQQTATQRHDIISQDRIAWIYYKNGKYSDALTIEDQAVRLGTEDALFYYHEGMIMVKLGRLDEAQTWLNKALMANSHFDVRGADIAAQEMKTLGSNTITTTDHNIINTSPGSGSWAGGGGKP